MRRRRSPHLVLGSVAGAALLAFVAGCGGSSSSGADTTGQTTMPSGMHMSPGTQMAAQHQAAQGPSKTASMVCGAEIHKDVSQTFEQPSLAAGTSTWSDRLFTCTYQLPGGPITVAVKDALTQDSGQAYFNALHAFDGAPALMRGLQAFGLPAYETPNGRVVFLKDGKTLVVDAGLLPPVAGPKGQSRTDVAYAVAADVIGCWSE